MTFSRSKLNRRGALERTGAIAGGIISAAAGIVDPAMVFAMNERGVSGNLVLHGVTVVDTHDGSLAPDMAVFVTGGTIDKIVPASSITHDRSVTVIDARGKYLVPGYNDLHAHPLGSSDPAGSLTLLLANGVTGFREMGAWNTMLEQRRDGTLVPPSAPELLELASAVLNPGNAATPQAAVATISNQLERGADFIKIIEYTPDVFMAVAAECARRDVRFLGHLAPSVDVRVAARVHMKSIEHMGPRDSILLGCSTMESTLRPVPAPLAAAPPTGSLPAPGGPVPRDVIARSVANPALGTTRAELARYQQVIDTYDDSKMHDLAAQFVGAGTWLVPTLIRVRTMQVGDDPAYRTDPNLAYVPRQTARMWQDVSQQYGAKFTADERATLQRLYERCATLVKPFKQAGVPMMTGSDLGGGFVVAGFGLHEEFDQLERAGLSPLDVLQMTTLNGAQFLGRESTMGTVSVGSVANLVVLDANPIASVQNLHRIAGVMRAGTYYTASALASMKRDVATRVSADVAYTEPLQPPCC